MLTISMEFLSWKWNLLERIVKVNTSSSDLHIEMVSEIVQYDKIFILFCFFFCFLFFSFFVPRC